MALDLATSIVELGIGIDKINSLSFAAKSNVYAENTLPNIPNIRASIPQSAKYIQYPDVPDIIPEVIKASAKLTVIPKNIIPR